jgi:hypothetical protein
MAWLTENWFWVLIFIAFIAMHVFGHGGHGGHGGHRGHGKGDRQPPRDDNDKDGARRRSANTPSGGHQH